MSSKLVLKPEDYDKIEALAGIKDTEEYSVVTHKMRGRAFRSIHVFERQPSTKELTEYEDVASKVKMKGKNAEVGGSTVLASAGLYDKIINRVYDLPIGRRIHGASENGPLQRADAVKLVPPLVKRVAIRDLVGEVYSSSQLEDNEGIETELDKEEES